MSNERIFINFTKSYEKLQGNDDDFFNKLPVFLDISHALFQALRFAEPMLNDQQLVTYLDLAELPLKRLVQMDPGRHNLLRINDRNHDSGDVLRLWHDCNLHRINLSARIQTRLESRPQLHATDYKLPSHFDTPPWELTAYNSNITRSWEYGKRDIDKVLIELERQRSYPLSLSSSRIKEINVQNSLYRILQQHDPIKALDFDVNTSIFGLSRMYAGALLIRHVREGGTLNQMATSEIRNVIQETSRRYAEDSWPHGSASFMVIQALYDYSIGERIKALQKLNLAAANFRSVHDIVRSNKITVIARTMQNADDFILDEKSISSLVLDE